MPARLKNRLNARTRPRDDLIERDAGALRLQESADGIEELVAENRALNVRCLLQERGQFRRHDRRSGIAHPAQRLVHDFPALRIDPGLKMMRGNADSDPGEGAW